MSDWEVRLPEKSGAWLGGRKPRAMLVRDPEGRGSSIPIPVAVGRRLQREMRDNPGRFRSFSDVMDFERSLERKLCAAKAESLLNRRDYSSHELSERLLREGYLGSIVEDYVGRARESGLVDDDRYADVFIRSKIQAGWGERKISLELSRRGIDVSDVPGWPDAFIDEGAERERALSLCSRKTFGGRDPYAKVVRFLTGRGFSASLAHDVAREVTRGSE